MRHFQSCSAVFGRSPSRPSAGLEEERLKALVNPWVEVAQEHLGVLVITRSGLKVGAQIKTILSASIPEEEMDRFNSEALGVLARMAAV